MKSDLEKRLEYVRSQREILQRTEEELQKQLEAQKSEFDFKAKMPVGSVWLGVLQVQSYIPKYGVNYRRISAYSNEDVDKIYYNAHQIVKAAQRYIESQGTGWHNLNDVVKAAEEAGVLQNLE